jgi:hypothetical protein
MKAEGLRRRGSASKRRRSAHAVLHGNAKQYGQEANVAAHVDADTIVRLHPAAEEIEASGAPRRARSSRTGAACSCWAAFRQGLRRRAADLRLRRRPDALLFEKGFAPTHAFTQFYLWMKQHLSGRCGAAFRDARRAGIHAGQAGRRSGARDWPDRLIGESAERLSLRLQQPVRGDAGQAPVERGHDHASDAAAGGKPGSTRVWRS